MDIDSRLLSHQNGLTPKEWAILTNMMYLKSREGQEEGLLARVSLAALAARMHCTPQSLSSSVSRLRSLGLLVCKENVTARTAVEFVDDLQSVRWTEITRQPVATRARLGKPEEESYLRGLYLSPSQEKVAREFFAQMSLNPDTWKEIFPNATSLKLGLGLVARQCDPDQYHLIGEAVKVLRDASLTITSPQSLIKTIAGLKMGQSYGKKVIDGIKIDYP